MNLNSKFGERKFLVILLFVLTLFLSTTNVYAVCVSPLSSTYFATYRSSSSVLIPFGYYGGFEQDSCSADHYAIEENLFVNSDDFRTSNMRLIFNVSIEHDAKSLYMNPTVTHYGGSRTNGWSYRRNMVFREGVYIYGSFPGVTLDMYSDGSAGCEAWFSGCSAERPIAYAAAQTYYLKGYSSDTRYSQLMNYYSSNNKQAFFDVLFSAPSMYIPMHIKSRGDPSPISKYHTSGYGVYFLAVTGGFNSENWDRW
ncbi:MAG TPA: hypothetical protein V6C58_19905, partial [Allocoleopsis sp.]